MSPAPGLPRWLPWVLLGAYVLAARGAGNLYPFSTFEMYGSTSLDSASRIVVRDGESLREVERFARWRCDPPPSDDPRVCARDWPFFHMESVDRAALRHVREAEAPGVDARRVELVRRIWRFPDTGAPTVADCVLARCEVSP
jgi:hypothetical protein